jgi:4-hydroxy-2-oxoheptanedioate aldolase
VPVDRVRERWGLGEPALNAWITSSDPSVAAAVAAAGVDAVTVDLQHGWAAEPGLADMVDAIASAGPVPMARVRWNDPAEIMRVLDLGVRGVICPMVSSRAEAERLVAACRYPPEGARSFGPLRHAFGTGGEHIRAANDAVIALAMIETAEGLANVGDIVATRGLDGLYVGPADLSLALGLVSFADLTDTTMLEALDRVVEAARETGVVAGVHAPSPERAAAMVRRGFRFVGILVDVDLVADAASEAVSATRALLAP